MFNNIDAKREREREQASMRTSVIRASNSYATSATDVHLPSRPRVYRVSVDVLSIVGAASAASMMWVLRLLCHVACDDRLVSFLGRCSIDPRSSPRRRVRSTDASDEHARVGVKSEKKTSNGVPSHTSCSKSGHTSRNDRTAEDSAGAKLHQSANPCADFGHRNVAPML